MRLTILGSGTSFGVPQVGCGCAVCNSDDPRDHRTRCGALLQADNRTVLIDTPPEIRLQLIAARVTRLDAVLYTHAHADHVAGIDDLRIFSVKQRESIPLYGPSETVELIRRSYSYIFDGVAAHPGTSKPSLTLEAIDASADISIAGIVVRPLALEHGHMRVFGYRAGPVAYVTDAKAVPEAVVAQLRGVDTLVLSALWWRPHPTHMSIDDAIAVARAVGARQTYLTHLSHETGHAGLVAQLPAGIAPAYDGLIVEAE